ncbi:MAG: hypothetical protein WCO06_04855 [Candidatus Roizmanbacteria bacterium]
MKFGETKSILYHYLAKLIDGEFITFNRDYFKKAEREGNIVLL